MWWAGRQPQNDADDSINPRELGRGIDFEPRNRQRKTSRCLPLDQPFSQWYPATDLKNDEESMQNIFKRKLQPSKKIKIILRILVGTLLAKKKKNSQRNKQTWAWWIKCVEDLTTELYAAAGSVENEIDWKKYRKREVKATGGELHLTNIFHLTLNLSLGH